MGLTIHYGLRLKTSSRNVALCKLQALHDSAGTLPFAELDDIVSFTGKDTDYETDRGGNEDHMWLKIQAGQYLNDPQNKRRSYQVCPSEIIAFTAWPGEGCEAANFGLCRYPKTLSCDGRDIPTRMATDWRWSSFCKTQYASNVNIAHFLRCHIMVIKMLDKAKELGFIIEVSDEGDYWEQRNVAALAKEVGDWNTMIAGFVGQLSDLCEGDVLVASIKDRGDFEHLEAKGRDNSLPLWSDHCS